jgi:hypothetical protein
MTMVCPPTNHAVHSSSTPFTRASLLALVVCLRRLSPSTRRRLDCPQPASPRTIPRHSGHAASTGTVRYLAEVTSDAAGGILQGTAALSDDILAASIDDTTTCGLITSEVGQRALDSSRASLATSAEMCELPSDRTAPLWLGIRSRSADVGRAAGPLRLPMLCP